MGSAEIVEWAAFFKLETEELKKAREEAERGSSDSPVAPDPEMVMGMGVVGRVEP